MKSLISIAIFLSLAISLSAWASETDGSAAERCSKNVAAAVQAQARIDYPRENLSALAPDLGDWDGGYFTEVGVQVVQAENPSRVVAVYDVTVDETCSVEIQSHRP